TIGYSASDAAPSSGLDKVELWVKLPAGSSYSLAATDSTPAASGHSFSYTAAGEGTYSFYTRAYDKAGNAETAPVSPDYQVTVLYDTTAPTVTIDQASSQSDPTNASPIRFAVHFSEPVSDFGNPDVSLSGSAGATTAAVTGSGQDYFVAVSGMTSSGAIVASIPAGGVHDAAGNANTDSTSTDHSVTYDVTAPGVTVNQASTTDPFGAAQADPTSSNPIHFTAIFSEP